MKTEKKAEIIEHIKKKYENQFRKLMENQTQAEKEEVLIGEKYVLKNHLAHAKEQILEIENRINIIEKFAIIDNTLAFNGVICKEVTDTSPKT
jgi:hypothetical protein